MDSLEVRKWKEAARAEQQDYFEFLGKRGLIKHKPTDFANLKRNIGYAVFGPPSEEPHPLNEYTGYPKKQLKHINEIFNVIKTCKNKYTDNVYVSFILVSGKLGNNCVRIPLIKMQDPDVSCRNINTFIFIDTCPRVYKGWQDYLNNNKLPACEMCYPRNGIYSETFGSVDIEFGKSPAGKIGRKVLMGFDIAGTVLGFAAAGVGIATFFVPVAMPLTIAAVATTVSASGYTTGRSIQSLVDRGNHQQSIGLNNAESRNCWLGIGGSVMGIASGGAAAMAARVAQTGETVALAGQMALKSVSAGTCVVGALGVINGLTNIIEKIVDKESVTTLDVFQFSSSVLFFTNAVISTNQALTLMNSIGKNKSGVITSNVESGGFTGSVKNAFSRISQFAEKTGFIEKTGFVELGQYQGRLTTFVVGSFTTLSSHAAQQSFLSVSKWVIEKFVEITKQLWKGCLTMANYLCQVGQVLQTLWESWKEEINEVIAKICEAFGVRHWSDVVIRGVKVLDGLEHSNVREIAGTLIAEIRELNNIGNQIVYSDKRRQPMPDHSQQPMPDHSQQPMPDHSQQPMPGHSQQPTMQRINEETETALSVDEIIQIQKRFVEVQHCNNSADFLRYLKFVCKFVQREMIKELKKYEDTLKMVNSYAQGVIDVEDFDEKYGISGNRNSFFLKKVLGEFTSGDGDGFFKLKFAYDSENAFSSAQDQEGQSFCSKNNDTIFDYFYNKTGLASNGFLSEDQFYDIAAELTEQKCDKFNATIVENGNTSVILINNGETVIVVQSYLEDEKVSGVCVMLRSSG